VGCIAGEGACGIPRDNGAYRPRVVVECEASELTNFYTVRQGSNFNYDGMRMSSVVEMLFMHADRECNLTMTAVAGHPPPQAPRALLRPRMPTLVGNNKADCKRRRAALTKRM
jgi:hypothetical protein